MLYLLWYSLRSTSWMLCSGNIDTLLTVPTQRSQDIREELLKFHERYYSSNVMALTVIGKGLRCFCSVTCFISCSLVQLVSFVSVFNVQLLHRPKRIFLPKARFPLPELTAWVDGWPVSITRQRGPCWRAHVSTSRVDGPSTRLVETRSPVNSCCQLW